MSLTHQTQRRLPTIKEGLLTGLTYQQIADKAGVKDKTIDRDIKAFVDSGEFETWIKQEWLRLHNIILHENPTEAYRNITKLVAKMLTQRMDVASQHYEEIKVLWEIKEPNPEFSLAQKVIKNSEQTNTSCLDQAEKNTKNNGASNIQKKVQNTQDVTMKDIQTEPHNNA